MSSFHGTLPSLTAAVLRVTAEKQIHRLETDNATVPVARHHQHLFVNVSVYSL